jgi:hypothetical protein
MSDKAETIKVTAPPFTENCLLVGDTEFAIKCEIRTELPLSMRY